MYLWLDLYAPYLAVAALALAAIALVWGILGWRQARMAQRRYHLLTAGVDAGNLEAVLHQHLDNVRGALERASQASETAVRVERASRRHLQHVAVVRYNPFSHTGGDQSFVLVLADAEGRGAIVTSLHAREGTRIYAKPLAGWTSPYALTEEEESAIARARGQGDDR
ncbi:MAG: DUF4446 family protein [Caldilineales bacterium]|nr:DUF4446 family protein [Caldilineales bacterium]MDW8317546.1 DUF4446 family protein [Anaerolineae bacterium]